MHTAPRPDPASGSGIVRYAAGAYTVEPTGLFLRRDLLRMRDGSVVAAGSGQVSGLVRHEAGTWTPAAGPIPLVESICELGNGEIAGVTTSLPRQLMLLRSSPLSLATLQLTNSVLNGSHLLGTRDGEVFFVHEGGVLGVGGSISAGIAHATPHCPAAATPIGNGCFGSAGAVTMAATDLPWLGATFHAQVTGMTAPTLGLHLAGVTPLVVSLPLGAPGCTLQVEPLLLGAFVASTTPDDVGFAVPMAPTLVGQQLLTQVVALELDASGAIHRTTSTNALQLTVGAY